jgi:hypothetical protein
MKFWIKMLKVFGYIWVTLAAILILAGTVSVWMNGGSSAVQELLSPFNIINWVVMVITLAPGIGAFMWAEKLSQKQALLSIPSKL